jgi:hypothetical protein
MRAATDVEPKDFYSREETSLLLGVTKARVTQLTNEGKLVPDNQNGQLRYYARDKKLVFKGKKLPRNAARERVVLTPASASESNLDEGGKPSEINSADKETSTDNFDSNSEFGSVATSVEGTSVSLASLLATTQQTNQEMNGHAPVTGTAPVVVMSVSQVRQIVRDELAAMETRLRTEMRTEMREEAAALDPPAAPDAPVAAEKLDTPVMSPDMPVAAEKLDTPVMSPDTPVAAEGTAEGRVATALAQWLSERMSS